MLMLRPTAIRALLLATSGAAVMAGCSPRQVVVIEPALDAEQLALALEDHTSLEEPIRIVFRWELNESGVRVSGRGVARVEPPYKARLDLFLGNGEAIIKAALVNGQLRLPPGAPRNILPPPDLMWGTLGVFRPEFGMELLGGDRLENDALRLRFRYADGTELHFGTHLGLLKTLEVVEDGAVVQRVEVELNGESRYPIEATYRNLADFRELKITRESVERVESYPPDIWDPMVGPPN
mgnify:CR=1 FL=1